MTKPIEPSEPQCLREALLDLMVHRNWTLWSEEKPATYMSYREVFSRGMFSAAEATRKVWHVSPDTERLDFIRQLKSERI